MVQLFPEKIRAGAPTSEKELHAAFKAIAVRDDWVVFSSLKSSSAKGSLRAEVDFMVLIPKKGIVLIEAKGATKVDLDNDEWTMEGVPEGARNKNPFDQIDGASAGIRTYLRNVGFDTYTIPVARIVWFTKILSTEANISATGAQFQESEIAWKDQIGPIIKVVEKAVNERYQLHRKDRDLALDPAQFDVQMVSQMTAALSSKLAAGISSLRSAQLLAAQRNQATAEQDLIITLLGRNAGIFFEGEAGTGKTHLLCTLASRDARTGRNVLYCCYNELLAEDIGAKYGAHPQIEVASFNKLLLRIAGLADNPSKPGENWFDEELPKLALARLTQNSHLAEYDTICIDEFQDLVSRPEILKAILALRRNKPREANVFMAADDGQQIFAKGAKSAAWPFAKSHLAGLAHATLQTNVRQPPELSMAIHELLDIPYAHLTHRIEEGLEWSLSVIATKQDTQIRDLAQILQKLETKYAGLSLRVLSPFRGKSALALAFEQSDTHSSDERWLKLHAKHQSNPDGDIRWRSISKYKGLEDQIIVITDISKEASDKISSNGRDFKDQIFVGATRSTQHVVILVQDGILATNTSLKNFLKS